MTNAEKLVKDIDYLVSIISFANFCNNFGDSKDFCKGCPLLGMEHGCTKVSLKEWLESEVKMDGDSKCK